MWMACLAGSIAGVTQALWLQRATKRGRGASGALLRLLFVALVLWVSSRTGHLAIAACGWFFGYVGAAWRLSWRWG